MTRTTPTYAIVTPSFAGDFDRCRLLVESVRRFGPGWTHYLIVDSHDLAQFRSLASPQTIVLDSRELLDRRLHKLPGRSGIWWNLRGPPVRGWMTQQIRKLAVNELLTEDRFLCCDSDTIFLRPFDARNFEVDGKLGLLDVDFCDDNVERWTVIAADLMGLEAGTIARRGHVGMMILWDRAMMTGLQRRIEEVTGTGWQKAVARRLTFSEYITYGTYVRAVVGYDNSPHAPSAVDLVRTSWGMSLNSETALAAFFDSLSGTQIAAMVHSKDDVPVDWSLRQFDRLLPR